LDYVDGELAREVDALSLEYDLTVEAASLVYAAHERTGQSITWRFVQKHVNDHWTERASDICRHTMEWAWR